VGIRLAASVSGQSERFPDVRVALRVLPGRPTARLLRVAERMDLLVVGRHRVHGVGELATGHVHTSIVDRVACPVAVVP
jgi:nucleotide-binding universal stress UspA family protein